MFAIFLAWPNARLLSDVYRSKRAFAHRISVKWSYEFNKSGVRFKEGDMVVGQFKK